MAFEALTAIRAMRLQPPPCPVSEFFVPLDGIDLVGDAAQHGRGIAGARSNFEHFVGWLELKKLDHARDDVRLGDGLAGLDGKRRVLVGEFLK